VIYNPTRVLDALDEAASSIMRFPNGRIMLIQKHVFRSDVVGENDIFTIPADRVSPTFLSQTLVPKLDIVFCMLFGAEPNRELLISLLIVSLIAGRRAA
jgi:hypothetical protein